MKVGIVSDLHLGAYGDRISVSGINQRMLDYSNTLKSIIDEMLERGVELCLFGGDAFKDKSGKPNPTQLKLVYEQFSRINTIMITGNHDLPRTSGETDALTPLQWSHNITISRKPEILTTLGLNIITLPYPNKARLMANEEYKNLSTNEINQVIHDMLIDKLRVMDAQLDHTKPSILLGHLSLAESVAGSESMMMLGRDICISINEIPESIDACFFGHIHKPQQLTDRIYVIGSPESVDFGEESDQKRWLSYDTNSGEIESINTNSRRYVTINCDYTDEEWVKTKHTLPDIVGAIVRVCVKLFRNQVVPIDSMRKTIMENGAYSVKFEREYVSDERSIEIIDDGIPMTQERIMADYCKSKDITGDRASKMIECGKKYMEANNVS